MSASTKLSRRAAADGEINNFCRAYYLCKIWKLSGQSDSTITNRKVQKCKVACGEHKSLMLGSYKSLINPPRPHWSFGN